jgi:hypothetical protein
MQTPANMHCGIYISLTNGPNYKPTEFCFQHNSLPLVSLMIGATYGGPLVQSMEPCNSQRVCIYEEGKANGKVKHVPLLIMNSATVEVAAWMAVAAQAVPL